jgi:hypothetical protein
MSSPRFLIETEGVTSTVDKLVSSSSVSIMTDGRRHLLRIGVAADAHDGALLSFLDSDMANGKRR